MLKLHLKYTSESARRVKSRKLTLRVEKVSRTLDMWMIIEGHTQAIQNKAVAQRSVTTSRASVESEDSEEL